MTGFGRAEHAGPEIIARVEIASVNRKQADIHFSLPRELSALEGDLKKMVLTAVSRGRVNVSINLEHRGSRDSGIAVNTDRAKALDEAFQEISKHLDRTVQLEAADFLRVPDVISFENSGWDPEQATAAIKPALTSALENLITMRTAEGADLKADLITRLTFLEEQATTIAEATPKVVNRQRELLHTRLRDAQIDLDLNDERLLKEIALFAERCDISEEATRLTSHLNRFHEYLDSNESVGRSLDFLCQEINREFNTIGSKANNADIGQNVVSAKTELEKIREQVQNIE